MSLFLKFILLTALCVKEPISMEDFQKEISRRVAFGYNHHISAARVREKEVTFLSAGDFSCPSQEAIYEIGSMTKLFTAHLALILSQEGLIDLDAPLDFLPSWSGKKITFRHLLTHTSGIIDPPTENYYNPKTENTVAIAEYSVEEMYEYVKKSPLAFEPGTKIRYSNLGYALIGHLLEEASKKDYFILLREKIFIPLQMKHTFIEVPSFLSKKMIQGYEGGVKKPLWFIPCLPAFASLKSTSKDLSLYLQAFFFSETSIPGIVKKGLTDPYLEHDLLPIIATLGWCIDKRGEDLLYVASGKTLGASSFMGFSPSKKEGFIVLTDSSELDFLGHHYLNPKFSLQKIYQEVVVNPEILKRWSGRYKNTTEDLLIFIDFCEDHLELRTEREGTLKLYPASENLFFSKYLHPSHVPIQFSHKNNQVELIIQNENNSLCFIKDEK